MTARITIIAIAASNMPETRRAGAERCCRLWLRGDGRGDGRAWGGTAAGLRYAAGASAPRAALSCSGGCGLPCFSASSPVGVVASGEERGPVRDLNWPNSPGGIIIVDGSSCGGRPPERRSSREEGRPEGAESPPEAEGRNSREEGRPEGAESPPEGCSSRETGRPEGTERPLEAEGRRSGVFERLRPSAGVKRRTEVARLCPVGSCSSEKG